MILVNRDGYVSRKRVRVKRESAFECAFKIGKTTGPRNRSYATMPTTEVVEVGELVIFKGTADETLRARVEKAANMYAEYFWQHEDGEVYDWIVVVKHRASGRRFNVSIHIEIRPDFTADVVEELK